MLFFCFFVRDLHVGSMSSGGFGGGLEDARARGGPNGAQRPLKAVPWYIVTCRATLWVEVGSFVISTTWILGSLSLSRAPIDGQHLPETA